MVNQNINSDNKVVNVVDMYFVNKPIEITFGSQSLFLAIQLLEHQNTVLER